MKAYSKAEWGKLRAVAVHKPGIEVLFGLIDPSSFLYEKPFNLNKAKKEHDELRRVLREEGIKVFRLKQVLRNRAKKDPNFRKKLVNETKAKTEDPFLLVELLTLKPSLSYETKNTQTYLKIELNDFLSNLYFMRDQQITTKKGIIIGKMATKQREKEVEIVKLFWEALGLDYIEINKGYLEGGDFFPMGDFSLIGIGNRSNFDGAKNLFEIEDEVGIVYETRKEFFHLDTFFNVASSNLVVGVKELMMESRVEVYYDKKLVKVTNLYDYIKEKGFNIVEVTLDEARKYATNFLAIDDGKVVSPKNNANKKLQGIDVIEVPVDNLTSGGGGIHCMTAVIQRD